MKSILHSKIDEITGYMRRLLLQGVDITGLYIVQAHLTSFKAAVKPISILMSLFTHTQLNKMMSLTLKRVNQLKQLYGFYKANGKQTEFNDIQRFKVSVKDFNKKPLQDLTVLAKQLLQTLQEWDIIQNKSQRFRSSLQQQMVNLHQVYTADQLKKQLEIQLQLLLLYNNEKQFKITESTECFSSFEEQQIAVSLKRFGEADVSMIFQYIVRWSNEVYHEIQDFKAIIQTTKDESSVDFQSDYFVLRATDITYGSLKITGKQNKGIRNLDHQIKASTNFTGNKQNFKKGQLKSVSFQINSMSSDFNKTNKRKNNNSNKVFSDFSHQVGRRNEIKDRKNEKQCCKCEIF